MRQTFLTHDRPLHSITIHKLEEALRFIIRNWQVSILLYLQEIPKWRRTPEDKRNQTNATPEFSRIKFQILWTSDPETLKH